MSTHNTADSAADERSPSRCASFAGRARHFPRAAVIADLCPHPCAEAARTSDLPCPAVAALADLDHLTPRERQTLWLVCLGLKNTSIAAELGVTEATVRLHLGNVHRKTQTGDKLDVVLQAWRSCVRFTHPNGRAR